MTELSSARPAISVIMPTYNTELSFLKASVDSILSQTFRDFEFIIIDDCSTNETQDYLKSLSDERVKIIRNNENFGVSKSLNIGLEMARGKYIARMDADDISLPSRLEKQFVYMENHPNVVLCGTGRRLFGARNEVKFTRIRDMETYRVKSFFYYPGPQHPTWIIRSRTLFDNNILYDEDFAYAQDYNFLIRISKIGDIRSLNEVLLLYRIHNKQVTNALRNRHRVANIATQKKLLSELLGDVNDREATMHYQYSYEKQFNNLSDFFKCFFWYSRLVFINIRVNKYPRIKFMTFAAKLFSLTTAQSFFPSIARSIILSKNNRRR